MEYTKEQMTAICHKNGPALTLAVPGSGKTTVLLKRINKLIESGVKPEEILSMTFSKAQALDMEKRYFSQYGKYSLKFSTIHAFAYEIVRKYAISRKLSLKLIESEESINKSVLINRIFFNINNRKIGDEELEEFFRISTFIKNSMMTYEDYKKSYGGGFSSFSHVFNNYENFKWKNNLIDFDDILVYCLKIFLDNPEILEKIQDRFKYIQIDEGQDTSLLQLKIINLLAEKYKNLFIVADDDQSIYGFRGASSKELLKLNTSYPQIKLYYMQDNFRFSKNIAQLSNKLISNNKTRYTKSIKPNKLGDEKVEIILAKNTKIQASYLRKSALDDINKGKSVAILYRNNSSLLNLLDTFKDNDDFFVRNDRLEFHKHFIISDFTDIINFSNDRYDFASFQRIYYKLNLFLKKEFLEEIYYMNPELDLIERLENLNNINDFYLDKFDKLSYDLDRIKNMPLRKSLDYILYEMEYYQYLKENARRMKNSIKTFDRLLDSLRNISQSCENLIDLENKLKGLLEKQKKHSLKNSKINLSTIHGAKGLEFDSVYIIDLVDQEFPSAIYQDAENENLLEEERRLFYVAMTRAKEKLTLISPKELNKNSVKKSRFLAEITN